MDRREKPPVIPTVSFITLIWEELNNCCISEVLGHIFFPDIDQTTIKCFQCYWPCCLYVSAEIMSIPEALLELLWLTAFSTSSIVKVRSQLIWRVSWGSDPRLQSLQSQVLTFLISSSTSGTSPTFVLSFQLEVHEMSVCHQDSLWTAHGILCLSASQCWMKVEWVWASCRALQHFAATIQSVVSPHMALVILTS